jgi:hypothetical protein
LNHSSYASWSVSPSYNYLLTRDEAELTDKADDSETEPFFSFTGYWAMSQTTQDLIAKQYRKAFILAQWDSLG